MKLETRIMLISDIMVAIVVIFTNSLLLISIVRKSVLMTIWNMIYAFAALVEVTIGLNASICALIAFRNGHIPWDKSLCDVCGFGGLAFAPIPLASLGVLLFYLYRTIVIMSAPSQYVIYGMLTSSALMIICMSAVQFTYTKHPFFTQPSGVHCFIEVQSNIFPLLVYIILIVATAFAPIVISVIFFVVSRAVNRSSTKQVVDSIENIQEPARAKKALVQRAQLTVAVFSMRCIPVTVI
jgi:hypothetical protein